MSVNIEYFRLKYIIYNTLTNEKSKSLISMFPLYYMCNKYTFIENVCIIHNLSFIQE